MLRVSIAGGSGYTGGELLRLLLIHPEVEVGQVTSSRLAGKAVTRAHPNLRDATALKFSPLDQLEPCDVLFLCFPHGETSHHWTGIQGLAPRIIDLSADFRIGDEDRYRRYYPDAPPRPAGTSNFVYGLPEINRDKIREACCVACPGCNATAAILALNPLYRAGAAIPDRTVVEVKVGSSEGGNRPGAATHHPVRSGCLRSFKPTGHRHAAEVCQVLDPGGEGAEGGVGRDGDGRDGDGGEMKLFFSATAVDQVRGILATCHVFLEEDLSEKEIWKLYRSCYGDEPFVRIVKERDGAYRYPEPKILAGTNYCDVGFEKDPQGGRVVVMSALDNLMKGAAGQAVQNLNLMCGFPERTALEFPGLHPV